MSQEKDIIDSEGGPEQPSVSDIVELQPAKMSNIGYWAMFTNKRPSDLAFFAIADNTYANGTKRREIGVFPGSLPASVGTMKPLMWMTVRNCDRNICDLVRSGSDFKVGSAISVSRGLFVNYLCRPISPMLDEQITCVPIFKDGKLVAIEKPSVSNLQYVQIEKPVHFGCKNGAEPVNSVNLCDKPNGVRSLLSAAGLTDFSEGRLRYTLSNEGRIDNDSARLTLTNMIAAAEVDFYMEKKLPGRLDGGNHFYTYPVGLDDEDPATKVLNVNFWHFVLRPEGPRVGTIMDVCYPVVGKYVVPHYTFTEFGTGTASSVNVVVDRASGKIKEIK